MRCQELLRYTYQIREELSLRKLALGRAEKEGGGVKTQGEHHLHTEEHLRLPGAGREGQNAPPPPPPTEGTDPAQSSVSDF